MKIKIRNCLTSILCAALLFSNVFALPTSASSDIAPSASSENVRVASRFFELLFGEKNEEKKSEERTRLAVSGKLFGIRMRTDGIIVSALTGDVATPLKAGDVILKIDGKIPCGAQSLADLLEKKSEATLTVRRGREEVTLTVPIEDGKLGVTVRDTAAGIGTVTFIDPETHAFGGLGHGICEDDGGELMPMLGGEVTDVTLGGVVRGACGKPGELSGVLRHTKRGDLLANHECGVFGILCDDSLLSDCPILEIAHRDEVHEGEATVLTTVRSGATAEYAISLSDIDPHSTGTKSFTVHIDDPALLAMTGGIVRGMSGSPIIQDGKLVGAVTHVMVADPTEGYGIFIENMLNASEIARNELPAA